MFQFNNHTKEIFVIFLFTSIILYSCGSDDDLGYTYGIRSDRDLSEYENLAFNNAPYEAGGNYPDFDCVGAVIAGENEGSGTLIYSNWVVTAAHNIIEPGEEMPDVAEVYFKIGNDFSDPELIIQVKQIIVHPGWEANIEFGDIDGIDIALVELESNVAGFTCADIYTGDDEDINGYILSCGFGDYTDLAGVDKYTLRHAFENILDRKIGGINPEYTYPGIETYKGGLLACDFDSPDLDANTLNSDEELEYQDVAIFKGGTSDPSALDLEGTTVPGDSGGALFQKIGATWYLIGVVSFGTTDSYYGDVAVFTRISSHTEWISSVTGQPAK